MEHKTKSELFLSVAEEFGELAKEIKVEQEVFCNAHKTLDEGSKGESVDVFITASAMLFAVDPDFDMDTELFGRFTPESYGTIGLLNEMSHYLADMTVNVYSCINVIVLDIFIYRITDEECVDFIDYVNKKLDKWERNQFRELGV